MELVPYPYTGRYEMERTLGMKGGHTGESKMVEFQGDAKTYSGQLRWDFRWPS